MVQIFGWIMTILLHSLSIKSFLANGIKLLGDVVIHWPVFLLLSTIPLAFALHYSKQWLQKLTQWLQKLTRKARFKELEDSLPHVITSCEILEMSTTGEELPLLQDNIAYMKNRLRKIGIPTPPVPGGKDFQADAAAWLAVLRAIRVAAHNGDWRYAKRMAKARLQ